MSDNAPPPDYDAIERRMWRENAAQVPELLTSNDPDLLKKIATYTSRFGYTHDQIREKIRTDTMFASQFAKEPRRQGVHEKEAAAWLQKLSAVQEFTTLPKTGKNAVYVTSDGEVKRGGELQARPSKSLDFRWRTERTTCYAMHKFTREGGGNQDSQFNEMRQLLQQFVRCPDTTCMLLVIVDGLYYTGQRLADLRRFTRDHPPQSYVTRIQDVPKILGELRP